MSQPRTEHPATRLAGHFWRYVEDVRRSPVQISLVLMSWWWISNGPVAFAINPSFSPHHVSGSAAGIASLPIAVNGWHALFHLITGLLGAVYARRRGSAIAYAIAAGAFYLVVAASGFAAGSTALGVIAVDTVGSDVHLAEGLIVLSAGLLAVRSNRLTPRAAAS